MTKTFILNNGVEMPAIGLGTAKLPVDRMTEVLKTAFDAGYTKIDTAWHYYNEEAIGQALKNIGIDRKKLFITNKLHIEDLYFAPYRRFRIPKKTVRQAFEQTCKRLGTDYIDLYLIHYPFPTYIHMWKEIEKLYKAGRIRAIGVASWLPEHMERIRAVSDTIPAVNQFEISPYMTNTRIIDYNTEHQILSEAFSSFGGYGLRNNVLSDPLIKDIADKYTKTTAQIILRWLLQQNISILPRSASQNHQKENIDIFNFSLEDDEIKAISALNKNESVWGWNLEDTLKWL